MSETTVVEKSKFDILTESIADVTAPVITFVLLILIFSILLFFGKIDQSLYEKLVLSGVLVSAVLALTKKNGSGN